MNFDPMTLFANIKCMSDDEYIKYESEQERKEKLESLYSNYKKTVPERYWKESLDTFKCDTPEQKKAVDVCRKYIDCLNNKSSSMNFIILGAVGCGKTHLACGIIREYGGVYKESSTICTEVHNGNSFSNAKSEEDIIRDYSSHKLLVIDEVGRAFDSKFEQYVLYKIINARYNRRKPTVIISNFSKDEYQKYMGLAIIDRLSEQGGLYEIKAPSYRTR